MDRFDELTGGQRFTRNDRLHHRREFDAVYSKGARVPGRGFILFILPNALGRCRLGVTLSRKVGGAVVRNRARRRLREIFRRSRQAFPAGCDVVVHARPEIAGMALAELERRFLEGLARYAGARRGGR